MVGVAGVQIGGRDHPRPDGRPGDPKPTREQATPEPGRRIAQEAGDNGGESVPAAE